MLYNKDLKKVHSNIDCITCKYFDREVKICKGRGKACFEYDPLTHTAYDPFTKMPIKLEK